MGIIIIINPNSPPFSPPPPAIYGDPAAAALPPSALSPQPALGDDTTHLPGAYPFPAREVPPALPSSLPGPAAVSRQAWKRGGKRRGGQRAPWICNPTRSPTPGLLVRVSGWARALGARPPVPRTTCETPARRREDGCAGSHPGATDWPRNTDAGKGPMGCLNQRPRLPSPPALHITIRPKCKQVLVVQADGEKPRLTPPFFGGEAVTTAAAPLPKDQSRRLRKEFLFILSVQPSSFQGAPPFELQIWKNQAQLHWEKAISILRQNIL